MFRKTIRGHLGTLLFVIVVINSFIVPTASALTGRGSSPVNGLVEFVRPVVQNQSIQGLPMRKKNRKKKAPEEAQEERGYIVFTYLGYL